MAYGYTPINDIISPPSIDEFNDQLAMLSEDEDKNVEVGMTELGHVVTKASHESQTRGFFSWLSGGGESFESCQKNLRDYLVHHIDESQLAKKEVGIVDVGQVTILGHAFTAGMNIKSAERLSYKDDADIYPDPAKNERIEGAEKIRVGDAEKLESFMRAKLDFQFPEATETDEALRKTLLDFYNFDQKATLELRDYLLMYDMSVPEQADKAIRKLEDLNIAYRFRPESKHVDAGGRLEDAVHNIGLNQAGATPVESMKMDRSRMVEFEFGGKKRHADRDSHDIPYNGPMEEAPEVSQEDIKRLEYRVVPDHQEVSRKIQKANEEAVQHQRDQDSKKGRCADFKTNTFLGMNEAQAVFGFKSGGSPAIAGAGAADAQGRRMDGMEDAHLLTRFEFQAGQETVSVCLAGVFDGHGGGGLSKKVSEELVAKLKYRLEQYNERGLTEAGVWNALKLTMPDLDRMGVSMDEGTTACTSMVIKDRLWTVNVGDSRSMVAYDNGDCLQVSEDEKPEAWVMGGPQKKYHSSLEKRGGYVSSAGKSRYAASLSGRQIAVARAIGDHDFSGTLSARGKVTSHPITDEMRAGHLVVGCDGIFDVATSDQIAQLIHHLRQQNPGITSEELAAEVLAHSHEAGSKDNLSVAVVPMASMMTG
ncbi:MAG: PP2C family serine/threonine-protein phosphatase [Endozoicomonas sp.]